MARAVAFAFAAALVGLGVWLSGVFATPPATGKWMMLAIAVYALPALVIVLAYRIVWVRISALWTGAFLLLQVPLSFAVIDYDYKTLPPNMNRDVYVSPSALPGVEGVQHITTDSKGFRVTKPIDYASDAPLRVFAIGGSTTEQIILDDRETWTHLLEQRLDREFGGTVEVINTGVSGIRAVHDLATQKAVESLHPDAMLFLIGVNDWNRHIRETYNPDAYRSDFRFTDTLLGRAAIALRGGPTGEPERGSVGSGVRRDQVNSLARADRRAFTATAVLPDYLETMKAMFERCRKGTYKCVFLTQPRAYVDDVYPPLKMLFWMTPPDERWTVSFEAMRDTANLYNQTLIREACAAGLAVIDVAKDLPANFDVFFDDVHFNEAGARVIADRLTPAMSALLKGQPAGDCPAQP